MDLDAQLTWPARQGPERATLGRLRAPPSVSTFAPERSILVALGYSCARGTRAGEGPRPSDRAARRARAARVRIGAHARALHRRGRGAGVPRSRPRGVPPWASRT